MVVRHYSSEISVNRRTASRYLIYQRNNTGQGTDTASRGRALGMTLRAYGAREKVSSSESHTHERAMEAGNHAYSTSNWASERAGICGEPHLKAVPLNMLSPRAAATRDRHL